MDHIKVSFSYLPSEAESCIPLSMHSFMPSAIHLWEQKDKWYSFCPQALLSFLSAQLNEGNTPTDIKYNVFKAMWEVYEVK